MERKIKADGFRHPDYQRGPRDEPMVEPMAGAPTSSWWAEASGTALSQRIKAEQARITSSRFGKSVQLTHADVEPARHKKQEREI